VSEGPEGTASLPLGCYRSHSANLRSGHTGEQIRDHKLACSIINLHGTEDCVFDERSLDLLDRFTRNRSIPMRDQLMQEKDWIDELDAPRVGEKAAQQGDLVGYLIVRYKTDDEALDDRDWELLDDWFRKGMPVGEHVQR
jgi:hypothetical protein